MTPASSRATATSDCRPTRTRYSRCRQSNGPCQLRLRGSQPASPHIRQRLDRSPRYTTDESFESYLPLIRWRALFSKRCSGDIVRRRNVCKVIVNLTCTQWHSSDLTWHFRAIRKNNTQIAHYNSFIKQLSSAEGLGSLQKVRVPIVSKPQVCQKCCSDGALPYPR